LPLHAPDDLRLLADRVEQLDISIVDPTPDDEAPDAVLLLHQQEDLLRLHQQSSRHALVRARAADTAGARPFALACTHLSYALADLSLAIEHTFRQPRPSSAPAADAPAVDRHAHRALARVHRRLGDSVESLREHAHAVAAPSTGSSHSPWSSFVQALASSQPVTVRVAPAARPLAGVHR